MEEKAGVRPSFWRWAVRKKNMKSGSDPAGPANVQSPDRLRRAKEMHQSYFRWLRVSRLAMAAFFVMAVLFFLWTLPWLPSGLEANDYTREVALTLYLLGGVTLVGVSTMALRELTRRKRERLVAWSSVYDEATGLHNRAYLYDRLSLECDRAERGGIVFSVFVLQIRGSASKPILSNAVLRRLAEMINSCMRSTDLVALLSGSELAVLAIGVGQEARAVLLGTLQTVVADELARHLDPATPVKVIGGTATYGVHGKEPAALVQAARTAASVGSIPRLRAA